MRSSRSLLGNIQKRRQVIITGQSLGYAVRDMQAALQFYAPGYSTFNTAVGSTLYSGLKKGTFPFSRSIQAGGSLVACIHGETDASSNTVAATYKQDIIDWQADYQTALNLPAVPFLLCQCSSQMFDYGYGPELSRITYQSQYEAALDSGSDNIYLLGPKYQYAYETPGAQPTGAPYVHMTTDSYSWLGQKYAQVLGRIIGGTNWKPLYPTSIGRSGAVITVNFNIPTGPLVLDTTIVSSRAHYGFEYVDSASTPTISSVVVNSSTVVITLSGTPTGTGKTLRYAYLATSGSPLATGGGAYATGGMAAGNIRDSDTFAQYVTGTGPYNGGNWLCHFSMAVP